MSSRYFATLAVIVFSLMLFLPQTHAQVVKATGSSTEASSQLIYYYDQANQDSVIQVTNTNDVSEVWIHVQIFRSFNAVTTGDPVIVLCDERNFFDLLTPNDTHVYSLGDDNFPKNIGESEVAPGESTSIDVSGTKGFVVITPVVSNVDATAISFEHMIGNALNDDGYHRLNAMGRSAVDLATGEKLADGTPLDGVTTGFQLLQPAELIFDFASDSNGTEVDIVGIVFADVYGPPGLLGYGVAPGTGTWTTFIFDFKESPTSCGIRQIECFLTVGLNDTFEQDNRELSPIAQDLLCAGSVTPPHPTIDPQYFGWTRVFVSGLEDNENMIGVYVDGYEFYGAKWMNTNVQ